MLLGINGMFYPEELPYKKRPCGKIFTRHDTRTGYRPVWDEFAGNLYPRELLDGIRNRLQLYQSQQPYRER